MSQGKQSYSMNIDKGFILDSGEETIFNVKQVTMTEIWERFVNI